MSSDGKNSPARLRYQEQLEQFYESLKTCRDEKVHGLLKEVESGLMEAFKRKPVVIAEEVVMETAPKSEYEVKVFSLSLHTRKETDFVH